MSENRYVLVETIMGDLQAEMLRGLLEAQGVSTMLSKEGYAKAIGLNVGPLGEVEILVQEDQLDLARQVLEDYYAGVFENSVFFTGSEEYDENDLEDTQDDLLDPGE